MLDRKLFESEVLSWLASNPECSKEEVVSHMVSCIKQQLDSQDIYTWEVLPLIWCFLSEDLFGDYFNEKIQEGKKEDAHFIVDALLLLQKTVEENTPKQRQKLYIAKEHDFVSGINTDFKENWRLATVYY